VTTQTLIYRTIYQSYSPVVEFFVGRVRRVKSLLPRPCMIVSVGLLAIGLCIPFLMGLTLLPASLFLGFFGMAFACIGIVLTLYYL
jgi:hypothetical protein